MTNEIKNQIIRQATLDAQGHQEEFPSQPIVGDWDSEAFEIAASELKISNEDWSDAWDAYHDALHDVVSAAVNQ